MRALIAAAFLLAASSPARAQAVWKRQISLQQRSSGSSASEEGVRNHGGLRTDDTEASFIERIPLGPSFQLMAGAGYARTELRAGSSPLPRRLQAAGARLGGEWLIGPRWWVFVNSAPGYYGDDHLDSRDFSVPADVQVNFLRAPGLRLVAGLAVDPFAKSPVTPFAGAVWRVNSRWNLNLLPPRLRAEYRAINDGRKRVELFSGLAIGGGRYRVSEDFGRRRGRPELDGQIVSRQEIGAEGGASLDWRELRAELSGGWLFSRRFKYEKSGVEIKAKGAPFVAVAVSTRL